jgi:hypothetical protein
MAAPQNVSLPPFFTLTNGMVVRLVALSPTSGGELGGVILNDMALSVGQDDDGPPVKLPPLDPAFLPGESILV